MFSIYFICYLQIFFISLQKIYKNWQSFGGFLIFIIKYNIMSNRKYKLNDNFFENIDCEKKAYALGLMYSDGNIHHDKYSWYITFGQQEERKDLVYKLHSILGSESNIHTTLTGSKTFYYFSVVSKKMYNDLNNLGVTPNKSLSLQFPKTMEKKLMPHFIRGLFDGDGCIWNGKRKKMTVKKEGTINETREKIIHNVKFTYTGNDIFVTSFQNFLINETGLKKTKLNFSKAKNKNNNTSEHICTMEYSGRGNIKKLYDYMYNEATVFSEEKKHKFDMICNFNNKHL